MSFTSTGVVGGLRPGPVGGTFYLLSSSESVVGCLSVCHVL